MTTDGQVRRSYFSVDSLGKLPREHSSLTNQGHHAFSGSAVAAHRAARLRSAAVLGPPSRGDTQSYVLLACLLIVLGVFYVATVHPGYPWDSGDDYAMYIQHARNLVNGLSYNDTGYIYNPSNTIIPKAYPPLFPIILAPVYKYFGLNFVAMKIEISVFFLVTLFLLFQLANLKLPKSHALAVALLVGMNPFFWNLTNSIMSEIPFMVFSYLAILRLDKNHTSPDRGRPRLAHACLSGVVIYLSYSVRTVGVLLIPAMLMADAIKWRNVSKTSIMIVIVFVSLRLAQIPFMANQESNYVGQLVNSIVDLPHVVWVNFNNLPGMTALWNHTLRLPLTLVVLSLAAAGYATTMWRGADMLGVFTGVYTIAVMGWNAGGDIQRLLIPVAPLYILYALVGLRFVLKRQFPRRAGPAFTVFVLAMILTYLATYSRVNWSGGDAGVEDPASRGLFDYIRAETDQSAVFVFEAPRVIPLLTGRRATVYHEPHDDAELWRFFREVGATHVIRRFAYIDHPYMDDFIVRNSARFEEVYRNDDFKILQIR